MSAPRPDLARLLARFLGREGPDVGCDACFELLDAYTEAALSGHDADAAYPGMRAHLDCCPACAEEAAAVLDLASRPAPVGPPG